MTATGGEKDRDVQASVDAASQLRVAKVPLGQSAAHGLLGANQLVVIKTDRVAVYETRLGPANPTAEGNARFWKANLSTALGRRPDRRSGHSGTPIARFQNQRATVPQSARECGRLQTVLRGDSVEFPCRPLNVGLSPEAGFAP